MARQPLVSIVIPCYNYGRYLAGAIQSALDQDYPNVEVIVIDDGSTDDSSEVAARYPVRLIRRENGGVCRARNQGAAEASGELLVFLDADDALRPEYVSCCWHALSTAPDDVAYAYTQMRYFGDQQGIHPSRPFSRRRLLAGNLVNASALVRRRPFEEVGGFDPSWKLAHEDCELWVRMYARGYRGVFVPKPLLCYRRHGASRNLLTGDQLRRLDWRLRLSYPRLYWRSFVRHPIQALRAVARQREPKFP